ncbi:MAG: EAL domain-containing protein [Betaproteobacteria bacterium]|nr:EAL domain-containing protein [Betaproteobacteria bacterium]
MNDALMHDLERALAASEARFNEMIQALDALNIGVVHYGPDDRLRFCNRRFREMYASIAPLLTPGRLYAEIALVYAQERIAQGDRRTEDEIVAAMVGNHRAPDGFDSEVQVSADRWLLIQDRRTATGGVIGFRLDITERKKTEKALAESESRFRDLLEMSSDWYWEQDAELRFTVVSEGHIRQLGLNPEDRIGKRRWELNLEGVSEEQWERHRRQTEAHEPFRHFEYQVVDARGERHHVSISGDPVFDAKGTFIGYRGTGTDISQRKRYEARIQEMAEYDFLTGLPNRSLLNARFAQAERQARRAGQSLALLFIDLDRFKNINDSLGHHVGDQILAETAERLRRLVRATDTVSRHGGDEFLILLVDVGDPANVGRIAEQILADLARPFQVAGHELIVTPSIGVTLWPVDGDDLTTLVRKADVAMYHSKSMGRNQFSMFREEMNTRVHERLALENALRRALGSDEFFLDYQPLFELKSRRIVSAEALLRWRHPELGLVAPDRFIPIAEDTGLIIAIGDLVIQKVCEQKSRMASSPHAWLPLAVNLSAIQLRDRHLLDVLPAKMREHGLSPGSLELEITETLLLSESEVTAGILQALRREGMRLVIDDFGTGYSNMGFLRRFAIDKLKIDQSFIRDIPADYNAMALARGIIGLARSIGLRTVAEGIETQAQLDFLIDAGCDEGQGYLLARPESCDTLINLLDLQREADQTRMARLRFLSRLKGT